MDRGKSKKYLRIGVTGGIGSGKSTVCAMFADLGRTVIPADAIARELTEHDPAVREEIETTFGSHLYRTDGSLERKRLAEIVFKNLKSREKLNAIVHPRVFVAIEEAITRLAPTQRTPYLLIEAALIYESGMDERLDYTMVVDAPEHVRIARVMARDACTREEVQLRVSAQMPAEKKRRRADFIIDNGGTTIDLLSRVAFLDSLFRGIAKTASRERV